MQPEIGENRTIKQSWSVIHRLSPEDSAAMASLRSAVAPMKGKLTGVAARGPFDGIMGHVATPEGVAFAAGTVGDISDWWAKPPRARRGSAILHLHGGWFNWGTALAFRNLAGHIALSTGADAFIPDYRPAPEHPFPAAVKDAEACYRGLVDRGIKKDSPYRRLGRRESSAGASAHCYCASGLGYFMFGGSRMEERLNFWSE